MRKYYEAVKLSTRARYALRMMLEVCHQGHNDGPVSMSNIARATRISKPYLEQLAIPLKAAGLLKGRAGRAGGYTLGRPADEIRVLEVVEAAIGAICVVDCVDKTDECDRTGVCETRVIWSMLNDRIRGLLQDYTLFDLTSGRLLVEQKAACEARHAQVTGLSVMRAPNAQG